MIRIKTITKIVWLEMLRRKDIYVLLILLTAMLAALVSLNIFGIAGTVRYIKDVGLMITWLFSWILAVTISCRLIPQEETRGTIFPLLAKPVSRFEFILGKWLGAWTITGAAVLIFYLLTMSIVSIKGGLFSVGAILQGFTLHFFALGIITSIGIMFSARMNNDAATSLTYVLTAAAFIVSPKIPAFIAKSKGIHSIMLDILYHMLPHFEVLDMRTRIIHNYGPVRTEVFLTSIAYALLLSLVFALIAWIAYRKKRFSRSDIHG